MFQLKLKNSLLSIVLFLCLLLCLCGCNSNKNNYENSHKFNVEKVISPTCCEEGYTQYACSLCGYKYRADYLPPLQSGGHSYNDCVCVDCGDFIIDEAIDTTSLLYQTISDDEGNEACRVVGISSDSVYVKIPSMHNGLPVTQIADSAFYNLLGLKHVVLPDSIVSIGNKAFQYCFNLLSINIPDSVTYIGENAFSNCYKIKHISLASITLIKDASFIGCAGLTSIVIPQGVTTIEAAAFAGCSSLVSIVIPNSVTEIGQEAFADCGGLTSITIPISIVKFSPAIFRKNHNLQDIYYEGTIEQWKAIQKSVGFFADTGEDAIWDAFTGDYTVHCSNGHITKSQTNL